MPQVDAFFLSHYDSPDIYHTVKSTVVQPEKIVIEILFNALQHPSTNPTSTPARFAFFY